MRSNWHNPWFKIYNQFSCFFVVFFRDEVEISQKKKYELSFFPSAFFKKFCHHILFWADMAKWDLAGFLCSFQWNSVNPVQAFIFKIYHKKATKISIKWQTQSSLNMRSKLNNNKIFIDFYFQKTKICRTKMPWNNSEYLHAKLN